MYGSHYFLYCARYISSKNFNKITGLCPEWVKSLLSFDWLSPETAWSHFLVSKVSRLVTFSSWLCPNFVRRAILYKSWIYVSNLFLMVMMPKSLSTTYLSTLENLLFSEMNKGVIYKLLFVIHSFIHLFLFSFSFSFTQKTNKIFIFPRVVT